MEQRQLNLFLEFTMRPYYYQDVAYGTCIIKLMPKVVRTVAKCTIIIVHGPMQKNWISTDEHIFFLNAKCLGQLLQRSHLIPIKIPTLA